MDNLIERLHNTRKTLMSGDGEWADAEAMDQCVTEAIDTITRLEADVERLNEYMHQISEHKSSINGVLARWVVNLPKEDLNL